MIDIASDGKIFEASFKQSAEKCGIYIMRLKDSAVSWNQQGATSFAPKNDCDMIMYQNPKLFLLEMKSTKGTSFAITDKIIKDNQIKQLTKASAYCGIIPGFIFNFRDKDATYFVNIKDFNTFRESSDKKSINQKDCEQIGIKIKQTLRKVNWHYHIDEFIKDINCEVL